MTCKCKIGEMCEKCQHLHNQALKYAQRGGPAYAQQLYYEELDRLKKEAEALEEKDDE